MATLAPNRAHLSLCLALALSVALPIGGSLCAQTQPLRILHVWVDPYFGDDALAGFDPILNPNGALNPNGPASFALCTPVVPPRPHQVVNSAGQILLHAPHPFKTITKAVDYIVATNPGVGQPLPAPGMVADWEHAVIHLMPGVYGLQDPPQIQTFGRPANGETFPIFLPPNVSVQGASALNTTLVETANNTPVFTFGVNHFFASAQRTIPINGENTFIDSVTITGGVENLPNAASLPRDALCGIWIAGDVASKPTITNCIFHGLHVGVGIGAVTVHGVSIGKAG